MFLGLPSVFFIVSSEQNKFMRKYVIVLCLVVSDLWQNRDAETGSVGAQFYWTEAVANPGFPRRGGGNFHGGGKNLLLGQIFPKTAWKWKNLAPGRGKGVSLAISS